MPRHTHDELKENYNTEIENNLIDAENLIQIRLWYDENDNITEGSKFKGIFEESFIYKKR